MSGKLFPVTPPLSGVFVLNSAQSSVTIGNFTNSSYIYFVFNSTQSSGKKLIGKVTAKNYLKESLLSILCFNIQGKGSPREGFDPEIVFCCIWQIDAIGFLVFMHAMKQEGFFASDSKYVVWNN